MSLQEFRDSLLNFLKCFCDYSDKCTKGLLIRYIHHFKKKLINDINLMHILNTGPSSMIIQMY